MRFGYKFGVGFFLFTILALFVQGGEDLTLSNVLIFALIAAGIYWLGKRDQKKNPHREMPVKKPKKQEYVDTFRPTVDFNVIAFNQDRNEFRIPIKRRGKMIGQRVYSFDKILDFELIVDEKTYSEVRTKGGITRAVVGGVLFNGVGALVGAGTARKKVRHTTRVENIGVNIVMNDMSNPVINIPIMQYGRNVTKLKSPPEEIAENIISVLKVAMHRKSC